MWQKCLKKISILSSLKKYILKVILFSQKNYPYVWESQPSLDWESSVSSLPSTPCLGPYYRDGDLVTMAKGKLATSNRKLPFALGCMYSTMSLNKAQKSLVVNLACSPFIYSCGSKPVARLIKYILLNLLDRFSHSYKTVIHS